MMKKKKKKIRFVWKMAGALKERELVKHVYAALQGASCPLVEGLYLQEADSMLQLLCAPSQHRTDILAWICSSINPNFANSKAMSMRSQDPDVLNKGHIFNAPNSLEYPVREENNENDQQLSWSVPTEIAVFGQELVLCKAGDLDLIEGDASPYRQLQFLEQLLTLVPECKKSAGPRMNEEILLNELYAAENLPHLTQMLTPTLDPWPANIKALHKSNRSSSKPSREETADVAALLHSTQSALEQLKSECEFLNKGNSPGVFSPSSLRVAACDLQQLMATFSHVYETDLRAYCSRDPPSFSTETDVFQRVQQLLLACNTEFEMLREASEASVSMNEEVNKLQTQPCYWSGGEKRTLPDQLEELSKRSKEFLSLLHI